MFRFLFISVLTLLCGLTATAQTFSVKGEVQEEGGPAIGAVVTVLGKDSSLVKGTDTDLDGKFLVQGLETGSYVLKISYVGFKSQIRPITISGDLDVGNIPMKEDAKQLQEVQVNTQAIIATQSGDTTSFNAKAFKTNKDANAEDLVSKMPGVTMQDGKIQAQGEDVKQVLVDGQVFFGDDAAAVLKNLPAEVIDKVQVFDKKSDQAQFTGFDDGNTSKTLNIVTKAEFRNGVFGKVYGGYGTDDHYKAGAVLNKFRNKQRLTLLVMSNNVNEQNFSSEDLLGVSSGNNRSNARPTGGGGRGSSGRGGFSDNSDNFLVNIRNGITTTNAAGLNYSDQWGKKTTVNGSYFFNQTNNRSQTDLFRHYVVGAKNNLNYEEANIAETDNFNHRLNLRIESQLDSMNSIVLRPVISFQDNKGRSALTGSNTSTEGVVSTIANIFNSGLNAGNYSLPVLFRHRFAKRGRTISLDVQPSYNNSGGNNALKTINTYVSDSTSGDSLDQRAVQDKLGFNVSGELAYTEPLGKNTALSFNYRTVYNTSGTEKNTFNDYVVDGLYNNLDTLLSGKFGNTYMANSVGPSLRVRKDKLTYNLSVMFQKADLSWQQFFPGTTNDTRSFNSILPGGFLRYNISRQKNLRVNYRTGNSAPQIEQMQRVVNNANSLQLSSGNPNLGQSYQHNLTLRYTGTNTEKLTSLFFMLGGVYTQDYIGNSTIIAGSDTVVFGDVLLRKGSQLSYPVNIDGQFSLRSFGNYTFPLKRIKSNLNLNVNINHNHLPALVNGKKNYSDNTNLGAGFVLSSNISEGLDFTLSSSPNYNIVVNSLEKSLNSTYYQQYTKLKLTYSPLTWIQFQVDYNNQINKGLSGDFNQNISLLNASVAWKFPTARNAELRLFVYDLLDQNNSIQRNITETYIEDVETTVLRRYFMLSFTWNFKRFATK